MITVNRLLCALSLVGAATFVVPSSAAAQGGLPLPVTPDRLSPPIPLGNTHPVLVAENADTIYAVHVTVDIDANGKADLNTLTLTGAAAEINRKAMTDWLRETTFRPAKRNGVPERGTFRMTAETLKQADPGAN
jgi:hypothetical protein